MKSPWFKRLATKNARVTDRWIEKSRSKAVLKTVGKFDEQDPLEQQHERLAGRKVEHRETQTTERQIDLMEWIDEIFDKIVAKFHIFKTNKVVKSVPHHLRFL
jgi:hypothetical protein